MRVRMSSPGQARAAEVGQLRRLRGCSRRSGTSTFWGLMSRWMTPRAWAWARAPQRAMPISSTWLSRQVPVRDQAPRACGPRRARRSGTSPPSRTHASYRATIAGCDRRAQTSASRIARSPSSPARAGSASAPPRAAAARPRPARRRRSRPRRGAGAAGSAPAPAPRGRRRPGGGAPEDAPRRGLERGLRRGSRRSISVRCESTGLRVRRGGRHSLRGAPRNGSG